MVSRISKMIRDTNKFLRSGTAIKERKIRYFVGLYSTVDHLFVAQLCFIVCKVFLFTFTYAQCWLWSRALRYLLEESSGARLSFLLAALCFGAAFIWKQSLFKTSYLPVTQYHAHVIISVYQRAHSKLFQIVCTIAEIEAQKRSFN